MSQSGPDAAEPTPDACPGCGAAAMRTLCHGTDRLYATTSRVFLVVECRQCRLIRLYPRPTPDEIQHYYPPNYWYDPGGDTADRLAESWRRFVLRDHVRFVRRALRDSGLAGPVLDVGCGGGLLLRELNLPQERTIGLDFSVNAASVAWSTNGVPAACGALPRAPFRPHSFSLITMFHVLEHLYDPAVYIQAARNLLHPKGRLVVQVPNAACWQFLLFGEAWNGLDIPRHLIDFKEDDLAGLLEYCGFEVVRRKHFSLRDNPAGLATTLATGLDPMARRIRGLEESPRLKLWKDFTYFALVLASIPFTLLEAACHAGGTIMLEARPKE
ncbi:MAG: class I SAM-dependent methyltransferase [Candidatus Solibacter usitatus]|nr:class I SAM-dependent methyltransferase [Candidatus Solibacter usitatus]